MTVAFVTDEHYLLCHGAYQDQVLMSLVEVSSQSTLATFTAPREVMPALKSNPKYYPRYSSDRHLSLAVIHRDHGTWQLECQNACANPEQIQVDLLDGLCAQLTHVN